MRAPATHAAARPDDTEYAAFYASYVAAVPDGDIVTALAGHARTLVATLGALDDAQAAYRYAEGKWSVREVIGHLIDAERIFGYRALRIARGDRTPLPGFEENAYVAASGADQRTMADLVAELRLVRDGTVALFSSLPAEAWMRRGIASDREVSVRALAWIMVGHAMHHHRVLTERYGVGL